MSSSRRRKGTEKRSDNSRLRLEPLEPRVLLSVSVPQPLHPLVDGLAANLAVAAANAPAATAAPGDHVPIPGDTVETGTRARVFDLYGGTWSDVEKDATSGEDDLLCWAATTSNLFEYTGWGMVGGMTNSDQLLDYYEQHWKDVGATLDEAIPWFFNGVDPTGGDVDVAGGGFYPNLNYANYFSQENNDANVMSFVKGSIDAGSPVGLWVLDGFNHEITCWGYNYDPAKQPGDDGYYLGVWITDSDDNKGVANGYTAPNYLHYYGVTFDGDAGQWFMPDYGDIHINQAASIQRANGTIYTLNGDQDQVNQDDAFNMSLDATGTWLQIDLNGTRIENILASSVHEVNIKAWGGNDTLTVDFAHGDPLANLQLNYDGGSGTDALAIIGTGTQIGSYNPATTAGDGAVQIGSSTITFTGLEPVTVSGLSEFTFVTPGSNDIITIDSPAAGQNRISGTSGGVAFESVTFFNVDHVLLDTATNDGPLANSNDAVGFTSDLVATGLDSFTVDLGAGNDTASASPVTTIGVTLLGGDGNDTLTGGGGNDYIDGGNGINTIDGGGGNNVLIGGPNEDFFTVRGSHDSVDGGGGQDVLNFYGTSGDTTVGDQLGVQVRIQDSAVEVYAANVEELNVNSAANYLIDDLAGKGVQLVNIGGVHLGPSGVLNVLASTLTVNGSILDDNIVVADSNAFFVTNPTVALRWGNVVFNGGNGDGTLVINGGPGDDRIRVDPATTLAGTAVTLNGDAGNDTLSADATLNGGDGDDTFVAIGGTDTVTGGAGFDTILVPGTAGNDTISVAEAAGVHTVTVNALTTTYTAGSTFERILVQAGDGNDIVTASGAVVGLVAQGGTGDDDINASAVTTAATLFGEAGNDVLHAAAGGGLLNGGDDDDVFLANGGLTGALTVEGGDPSHSDVLALTGAAATVETVTIAPDGLNPTNQSVTGLGATITASGVELIGYTGVGADDTLTVTPGPADDRVRVESAGSVAGVDRVVSSSLPIIHFTGLDTFVLNLVGGVDVATFATFALGGAVLSNYEVLAGTADLLVIEGIDGALVSGAGDSFLVTNPGAGAAFAVTDQNATNGAVTVTATSFSSRPGRLQINTLGGDDLVTVDVNGPASDVIGVPITFDGGSGADSLLVTGTPTTLVTFVTQTPGTEPGDGRLLYQSSTTAVLMTIDYANLEPVTDLVVATTLMVNATNAANLIDYTSGSAATRGLVAVDDNETLEFSNKTTLVLNGLGGNDEIHIDNAFTPTGLTDIRVNGGSAPGVDTLIVDGTSGVDVFTLTATGAAAGTVALNAEPLVTFAAIGAVTLRGKEGADTFTPIGAVALAGPITLDGGQGADTFAIGAYTGKLVLYGDDGSDWVDFSGMPSNAKSVGVTIDLDRTDYAQKVDAAGLTVTLRDAIENFVGSPNKDQVQVDALTVERTIDGRDPAKVTPGSIPPGDLLTVDGMSQFVTVDRIDPLTGQPSKDSGTVTAFSYAPIAFSDIEKLAIVDTLGSTGFGGSSLPAYTPGANYSLFGNKPGDNNGASAVAAGNLDPNNPDADFTGNTWQDLVVIHQKGLGFANVLLNRGDGTFVTSAPFATGLKNVTSVALADVDGDGTLDIIALGLMPTGPFKGRLAISLLTGNDDGTFNPFVRTITSLKGTARDLAVGDLDGTFTAPLTGPDVVLTNGKQIRVLLNNGAGVFTVQPVLPASPLNKGKAVLRDLQLADLNGDGSLDLVAVGYKANCVSVFTNTGFALFAPPVHYATAGDPRAVAIGDLNNDGINDLAIASAKKPGITVLLGQSGGTFRYQPQASSLLQHYQTISLGDVNSDGKLDIVLLHENDKTDNVASVYVLLGAGNGTFSTNPYVFSAHDAEHHQPDGLALADFNSDGGLDIAMVGAGTFDVSLLLKNTVI